MPATIATVVIMIGRVRLSAACVIAVVRSAPACIASIAKSSSMMAFLVTIPISIRIPITTGGGRAEIGGLARGLDEVEVGVAVDRLSRTNMAIHHLRAITR